VTNAITTTPNQPNSTISGAKSYSYYKELGYTLTITYLHATLLSQFNADYMTYKQWNHDQSVKKVKYFNQKNL